MQMAFLTLPPRAVSAGRRRLAGGGLREYARPQVAKGFLLEMPRRTHVPPEQPQVGLLVADEALVFGVPDQLAV